MTAIVGVAIDSALMDLWATWLAPTEQPFFVDTAAAWPEGRADEAAMSAELRDTFKVWRVRDRGEVVWLSEDAFAGLDRDRRRRLVRSQVERGRGAVPAVRRWTDLLDGDALRRQVDGHRFVWWPSLVESSREAVLERFAAEEGDRSRHRSAPSSTWQNCRTVLPLARELAGTFARGSGPNCFGTVMVAAGVEGAAGEWVLQAPFEAWLESACVPGGRDDEAGTVFVWRDASGDPVHAAVTIGDGYALEKPAQTWWTPRIVATVDEVKRASRARGQRLERHRIDRARR